MLIPLIEYIRCARVMPDRLSLKQQKTLDRILMQYIDALVSYYNKLAQKHIAGLD